MNQSETKHVNKSQVTNIIDIAMHRASDDDNLSKAFHSLETALNHELASCFKTLNSCNEQPPMSLLESIAQIQCALDIVQSADTPEDRLHIYSILKEFRAA